MKNYKIIINSENDPNSASVDIEGEISIETVGQIITEINPIIDKFQKIDISVRDIFKIDLSGIQYFITLKKTLTTNDKTVNLNFEFSDEIRDLISDTGLLKYLYT